MLSPYAFTYGQEGVTPSWKLCQWDSRYSFRDETVTAFTANGEGEYVYENPSKRVTVNTKTGELGLRLCASAVYESPRQGGESWPHLLLEQAPFAETCYLKDACSLRFRMPQKLTYFSDAMGKTADPSLHACSFFLYLYVKGVDGDGVPQMMWFGMPLFDNRTSYSEESFHKDGGKSDATGLFIYNVPSRAFTDTDFLRDGTPYGGEDNRWMEIDVDLLPFIHRAFALAQQNGCFQGVNRDTLYVDGMNLGWEMPGTYDAEMTVKGLSL